MPHYMIDAGSFEYTDRPTTSPEANRYSPLNAAASPLHMSRFWQLFTSRIYQHLNPILAVPNLKPTMEFYLGTHTQLVEVAAKRAQSSSSAKPVVMAASSGSGKSKAGSLTTGGSGGMRGMMRRMARDISDRMHLITQPDTPAQINQIWGPLEPLLR